MKSQDFRSWGHRLVDWSVDFLDDLRSRPVRSQVEPGEILSQLPDSPPEAPESMEAIFEDFEKLLVPGMTQWQHPRFFAYFPANSSPPSVLAEQLTTVLGAQCMLWQTSPAATELEIKTLDWLRQAIGLPDDFSGVIQDSASTATLCAVLTLRERALGFRGNSEGLSAQPRLRLYTSDQAHSSIDRAVWIAGLGADNLVKLPTSGPTLSVAPQTLRRAIEDDLSAGYQPAGLIACVGATSVGASDSIRELCEVAREHHLYVHVDAAWAGSAMICPEFRHYIDGAELADSFVFNPHKWLLVNFDCSAHFVKSPEDLVRTLAIQPEYLRTHGRDGLINFSEWSVPLGRRFRALKLWFVLRHYGLEQLREIIRRHVAWSQELAGEIDSSPDFELTSKPMLSLFSFRYAPPARQLDGEGLDRLNLQLLEAINSDGRIYVTGTSHQGRQVIRFQVGQTDVQQRDVQFAWDVVREIADTLDT